MNRNGKETGHGLRTISIRELLIYKLLPTTIVGISLACGGSSPKYPPSTNAIPSEPAHTQTAPEPQLRSNGSGTIKLPGVYIAPPGAAAPGTVESGPVVFTKLDLDNGKQVTDGGLGDVDLSIDASRLTVNVSSRSRLSVKKTKASYGECKAALDGASETKAVGPTSVPTDYICVETDEGRIAEFRFTNIGKTTTNEKDIWDVNVAYVFETW